MYLGLFDAGPLVHVSECCCQAQHNRPAYYEKNLTPVPYTLDISTRERHYDHSVIVLWLTGLTASGKSSRAIYEELTLSLEKLVNYVRSSIPLMGQ